MNSTVFEYKLRIKLCNFIKLKCFNLIKQDEYFDIDSYLDFKLDDNKLDIFRKVVLHFNKLELISVKNKDDKPCIYRDEMDNPISYQNPKFGDFDDKNLLNHHCYKIKIIDIVKINKISQSLINKEVKNNYFIKRDENGRYYANDKLLNIHENNNNPRIFFDCLFNLIPKGGFISYGALKDEILEKHKIGNIKNRTIQNALTSLQEGIHKQTDIPFKNKLGNMLLITRKRKGFVFNNHTI